MPDRHPTTSPGASPPDPPWNGAPGGALVLLAALAGCLARLLAGRTRLKDIMFRPNSLASRNLTRIWAATVTIILFTMAACGGQSRDNGPNASAPAQQQSPGIRIAAASDLQFAMPVLIERFQQDHPAIPVNPTFGSSGNFFAQLRQQAPFDMYFSADMTYPQRLGEEGLLADDSLFEYAVGRVAVTVRSGSALDVETLGIEALTDSSVRKIAIANPEHAPYGVAAEESMRSYGIYDQVAGKLVLGENVSQAAQFIDAGAADVGIIALSLALAPAYTGSYFEIPADRHNEILQGGAIMAAARDPEAAQLFREFLLSEAGKAILADFGFVVPSDRSGN